jgi:ABC-type multidrug transport system ATPase subunit
MPAKAKLAGETYINNEPATLSDIRHTSSYVEQDDHLIGSITAAETLAFAAKLGANQWVRWADSAHIVPSASTNFNAGSTSCWPLLA